MKTLNIKKTLLVIAFLALANSGTFARSWRINSNANMHADFTDLNAAMSSSDVVAGDTLCLDPGCVISTEQSVTKSVTIVGNGFFRNAAPHSLSTITGRLYLSAAGIKVEGVILQSNNVFVRAGNITIERCHCSSSISVGYSNINAQYATIRQCYITGNIGGYGQSNTNSAYCTVENCIFNTSKVCVTGLFCPVIRNNYLKTTGTGYCLQNMSNGSVINNIIMRASYSGTNVWNISTDCTCTNNLLCMPASVTSKTDNLFFESSDESAFFALQGTNDQLYRLKDGSPAKGYATDGGDCGPYGGAVPYVPSGLPLGRPYYTKASVSSRAADGKVNVSLNIQLQDE